MIKKILFIITFILIFSVGVFFVFYKNEPSIIREPLPSQQIYSLPTPALTTFPSKFPIYDTGYKIQDSVNLAVPFTVQAPNANWDEVHQEFCEEASILMAASYVKGWDIPDTEMADKKMFEIKDFEERKFGYYKDTTAEEMAIILREFYKIEKVEVIYNPTADTIKQALNEKKVIIAPAAGRQLDNPYYRQPGPLYHALVIKGYTKTGNFITNDPGTRRGADFIYLPDILMNAIHDWNSGDVENGRRVIIIVG